MRTFVKIFIITISFLTQIPLFHAELSFAAPTRETVKTSAQLQKSPENAFPKLTSLLKTIQGNDILKDQRHTFSLASAAAEKGDLDSKRLLAIMYLHGIGTAPDRERSSLLLKQLAYDGNAEDKFRWGRFLYLENSNEKNRKAAGRWFINSAREGNLKAQRQLARMFLEGDGLPKNSNQARYWLQRLSIRGDNLAKEKLGWIYFKGIGVERDFELAFRLFLSAAEAGLINAQVKVANMYFLGQGSKRNYVQSFLWTKKAAENGSIPAQYNLAVMYDRGLGISKQPEASFYWFEKAGNQNFLTAQLTLAWKYRNGIDVRKDPPFALIWYKKAAMMNKDIMSLYNIGSLLAESRSEKEKQQAFYWWHQAAKHSLIIAESRLGYCYASGFGIPQDMDQARFWLNKAADDGDENAKNNLKILNK